MTSPIEVLHVDDDAALLDIAATFLERADERLHVSTETDPTAVPGRLEDGEFDCVVSDYNMPQMTGLELLSGLKREYPDLPFVLFTGTDDAGVAVDALAAGATDFCRKQTGTEHYQVLAARITDTVEHRRERERLQAERDRLEGALQSFTAELAVALDEENQETSRLDALRAADEQLREVAEELGLDDALRGDGIAEYSSVDPGAANPCSDD